jgi:hypothetical protein
MALGRKPKHIAVMVSIIFQTFILRSKARVKVKGKVPHWGTSTPQPQGLLCSHPEGVPSFISRGAAHRTVYSASASEGRN